MGPWKKSQKTVLKKITTALKFPMIVKAMTEDMTDFQKDAADMSNSSWRGIEEAIGKGKEDYGWSSLASCDFTKATLRGQA